MSTDPKLLHVRAQADALGVKYHHRAGITKIQELIDLHLDGENPKETVIPVTEPPTKGKDVEYTEEQKRFLAELVVPVTEEEYLADKRREDKMKVGALVHCRVTCMNPDKRDWPGEILSVGSAKLGTFKKYIPFNNKPYHIPKIIYDMMKEKKCSVFQNSTDDRGRKTKKAIQINEYNIEILPPLTPKELDDLRIKQAMAKGNTGIN